jgi:internalin A
VLLAAVDSIGAVRVKARTVRTIRLRTGWLRFSVRGLMLVVVATGVWLGWLARNARIQREAVASIKRAGGHVLYDWQWKNGHLIRGAKPSEGRWMSDFLGVDYFHDVTGDFLLGTDSSDDELESIGRLTRVELLILGGSRVTDRGLSHLRGMRALQLLEVFSPHVTDDGLAHLAGLSTLRHLNLSHNGVTDRGLRHLVGLANLRTLRMRRTRVTYRGLEPLRQALPCCEFLVGDD